MSPGSVAKATIESCLQELNKIEAIQPPYPPAAFDLLRDYLKTCHPISRMPTIMGFLVYSLEALRLHRRRYPLEEKCQSTDQLKNC